MSFVEGGMRVLLLVLLVAGNAAWAAKDRLPSDLEAYLYENEPLAVGVTDAVREHFLAAEIDGTSCSRSWSKAARKSESIEDVFRLHARGPCLGPPLETFMAAWEASVEAETAVASDACEAPYPPGDFSLPPGPAPSDMYAAYAWAHEPRETMDMQMTVSHTALSANWWTCRNAVNRARDLHGPLSAWIIGSEEDSGSGVCTARLPEDPRELQPLAPDQAELCLMAEQPLALAHGFQRATSLRIELEARVAEAEGLVAAAMDEAMSNCPTETAEEYAVAMDATKVWDLETIEAPIEWLGIVLHYCGPVAYLTPEDSPEPFRALVEGHSWAIRGAGAILREAVVRLPELEGQRAELEAADEEVEEDDETETP